jgi:hypothetical protein
MQVCKNLILALASFSTASRLWTPPTCPEHPNRPDSGRSDIGQSARTVQNNKASRAGRFVKSTENRQLHSLLHIKVLWLASRIKQA